MEMNQPSQYCCAFDEEGMERNGKMTDRQLEAAASGIWYRSLELQEVLSKPGPESAPLADQELFELSIEKSEDVFRPGFVVKQSRAQ